MEYLKKARSILSKYYNFVNKKEFFDSNGKLSPQFLEFIKKYYNLSSRIGKRNSQAGSVPWRKSVRIYLKVLKNLTGLSETDFKNDLYSLVAPTSRDLGGVEEFLSIINDLILKLTVDSNNEFSSNARGSGRGSSKRTTLLYLNKYYENVFDADIPKDYGFDFFGNDMSYNLDGLPTISIRKLLNRFNEEGQKLGKPVPQVSNTNEAKEFYSKLSPTSVNLTGDLVDLSTGFSEKNTINYHLAFIKNLKMKTNSAGRSISMPEKEAGLLPGLETEALTPSLESDIVLAQNDKENKILIAQMYKDYLALGSSGASFRSADPPSSDADLVKEGWAGRKSEEVSVDEMNTLFPGGEKDGLSNIGIQRELVEGLEQAKEVDAIVEDLGLENLFNLAAGPASGPLASTFGTDFSVSLRYGTNFDNNLNLESLSVPFQPEVPYIAMLTSGVGEGEDEIYDAFFIITPGEEGDAQENEEFLGDPDLGQSLLDRSPPQETRIETEEPVDDLEPEDGDPNESGDSSDSTQDSYLNIGYEEEEHIMEITRPEKVERQIPPPAQTTIMTVEGTGLVAPSVPTTTVGSTKGEGGTGGY